MNEGLLGLAVHAAVFEGNFARISNLVTHADEEDLVVLNRAVRTIDVMVLMEQGKRIVKRGRA